MIEFELAKRSKVRLPRRQLGFASKNDRKTAWKPDKCAMCKIIQSCPTCAGFNWEENGDTGIRTTYHCDAHKLEAIASAKIVAERLKKCQPLIWIQLQQTNTLQRPSLGGYQILDAGKKYDRVDYICPRDTIREGTYCWPEGYSPSDTVECPVAY